MTIDATAIIKQLKLSPAMVAVLVVYSGVTVSRGTVETFCHHRGTRRALIMRGARQARGRELYLELDLALTIVACAGHDAADEQGVVDYVDSRLAHEGWVSGNYTHGTAQECWRRVRAGELVAAHAESINFNLWSKGWRFIAAPRPEPIIPIDMPVERMLKLAKLGDKACAKGIVRLMTRRGMWKTGNSYGDWWQVSEAASLVFEHMNADDRAQYSSEEWFEGVCNMYPEFDGDHIHDVLARLWTLCHGIHHQGGSMHPT